VEDAFQRLAMLTNEESLTAAARTLELASNIDENVTEMKTVLDTVAVDVGETNKVTRRIDRGVAELREINLDIGEDVLGVKEDTRSIKKDVRAARRGA
jgi:hypothetical protein